MTERFYITACLLPRLDVSKVAELWFDTSSDFLTVKFRDSSHFVVCADLWTEHLSDLVCIHAGCKYVHIILYSKVYRPIYTEHGGVHSLLLS